MTDAEKALVEQALAAYNPEFEGGHGPPELSKALRMVLLERLPPEYEATMRDLAFRAFDALEAMNQFSKKNVMGPEFVRRLRKEWRTERGIREEVF